MALNSCPLEASLPQERARGFEVERKDIIPTSIDVNKKTVGRPITWRRRNQGQRGHSTGSEEIGYLLLFRPHIQGITHQKIVERWFSNVHDREDAGVGRLYVEVF